MDKLEEELANIQRSTQEKKSCLDSKLKRIEKDLSDAHCLLERTNTEKVRAEKKNILLCQEIDNLLAKNEQNYLLCVSENWMKLTMPSGKICTTLG
jgi:hypothetical protein